MLLLCCLPALGAYGTWHSLISLPRTYDALERRGVPATASVDYVRRISAKDDHYKLTYTFHGIEFSERYAHNYSQFGDIGPGETVPVLVDPQDPETALTVTDVRERTNAGFSGLTVFTAVGTIAALWFAIYMLRLMAPDRAQR